MEPIHRVERVARHLLSSDKTSTHAQATSAVQSKRETISVTDNRTGKQYEFKIKNGMVDAKELNKLKTHNDRVGIRSYDPGFVNTASATSRITYIDGENGILTYRGYPIEELAEKSTFLEVSYLLLYGELPSQDQLDYFTERVMRHTFIHEDLAKMMKGFRYDAHPMGMVISTMASMSTLHPEANPALAGQSIYDDMEVQNKQIHRIIGTMPTIAAFAYRHRQGRPYVNPAHQKMTYTENFMYMLDRFSNANYRPHPRLARALDILFILHADHELNCSTAAMRHLASSGVDVYTGVAGATAALYGPRHGGANEAVLRMLESIGSVDKVPEFIKQVKERKVRLMGFGHRVYRNYDPRAKIIRKIAKEVFEIIGYEPLIELAVELEKQALSDPYFIERKLYPNVDFYSGLIYRAMGFPTDFFPVLFAIPRTVGWLAHWREFLADPENRIVRPRQKYLGSPARPYVEIGSRKTSTLQQPITSAESVESKRRYTATVPP